jgi:hypothetical protein
MNHRVIRTILPVFALLATAPAGAADMAWEKTEGRVALMQAGRTVWAFNHGADATKPHFHPLTLGGGSSMTWLRPPDHVWHCGLWFSWKFINQVNYWEEDKKTGKPAGLTLWSNVVVETRPDFSARIAMDVTYAPPGQPAVMTERRVIMVSAPAADGAYTIDWDAAFKAGPAAVVLEATPVNPARTAGGYGGLIWRVAADLKEWQAVSDSGRKDLAAHGEPARALDFSGILDGKPAGIAILDHRGNRGHPTPWFLRLDPRKPYGLHGPGILFNGPVTVAANEAMPLRYRAIVHPGRWTAEDLAGKAAAYRD